MAVSAEALPRRGANRWPAIGRYALLVTAAAVVLFPVYCAFVIALQPTSRLLSFPGILLPTEPDLSTFSQAFEQGHLGRYLLNSAVASVLITLGQIVTSILAAYALAFLQFKGKSIIFTAFLATLIVPTEVTIVPNLQPIERPAKQTSELQSL